MSAISDTLGRARHTAVLRSRSGRVGVVAGVVLLAVILLGPLFAPYPPAKVVGPVYAAPGGEFLLGTDVLGRDVLSRVLSGGRTLIGLAGLATLLAYLVGTAIGLIAGASRSFVDPALMRGMDVLLAFPPILFLLVLATGAGPGVLVLVIGVAVTQVPGIARVVRSATLEASVRSYVEAAIARGERRSFILGREILPNIARTILADVGVRLTAAIVLIASINFLGLGLQPPLADWALMISENRSGLTIQPWATIAPVVMIAAVTMVVNLVADAVAEGLGVSPDRARAGR